ncbi:MAG: PLP-dependent lyase/thiolase, partial [Pseudomonadota bacterium]
ELLAKLEGMERGPAGNTSLAGALAVARELDRDQILVVQETEYTAAGKMPSSQLTFAKKNGIKVTRGNPRENTPGKSIVIPERIDQIAVEDFNMEKIRLSYIENSIRAAADYSLTDQDERFLAEDSKSSLDQVHEVIQSSNH